MDLGETCKAPQLEAIVAHLAERVIGKATPVNQMLLIRLPEQRFIHGALILGGRMANLIYFEEIGVGLLGIVMSAQGDNQVIRFTTGAAPGGGLGRN
jgi:hypothetical protein